MKRLVLFAVVLGALSITSQVSDAAKQQDQYLCVADERIGFGSDTRSGGRTKLITCTPPEVAITTLKARAESPVYKPYQIAGS
jgi:hypothetical protein